MEKNEPINEAIREHETSVPWEHQRACETFYAWFDRFEKRLFEEELPTPVLSLERVRRDRIGRYLADRNAEGALHEMLFNTLLLEEPLCEQLAFLLHLMVHEWQSLHGRPGTRGYHNKEFCRKADDLGIPCEQGYKCIVLGLADPFAALLAEEGIAAEREEPEQQEERVRVPGARMLPQWSCGCGGVFTDMDLNAVCNRCGQLFVRTDEQMKG